ncbi:MAG: SDR family oxidoreductase [FCB group bacterium]|nr:SDR family oxidoreductase [FCB group bacterium]
MQNIENTLSGFTFVVTGANRGIGFELVRQLQKHHANTIATARSPQEAVELRKLKVRLEALDITNPASIDRFTGRLNKTPVDVLINNAGIGIVDDKFDSLKMGDINRHFQVNCIGTLQVVQALLPFLRRGKRKLVINLSSKSGSISQNVQGTCYGYRASKAALNMLTKNLSIEFASQGFTFILMHPGSVRTDMTGHQAPLSPQESVQGMLQVIQGLGPEDNGSFIDYKGEIVPW